MLPTTDRIDVTRGQVDFEWNHLMRKLEAREQDWYAQQLAASGPRVHLLFRAIPGGVADW